MWNLVAHTLNVIRYQGYSSMKTTFSSYFISSEIRSSWYSKPVTTTRRYFLYLYENSRPPNLNTFSDDVHMCGPDKRALIQGNIWSIGMRPSIIAVLQCLWSTKIHINIGRIKLNSTIYQNIPLNRIPAILTIHSSKQCHSNHSRVASWFILVLTMPRFSACCFSNISSSLDSFSSSMSFNLFLSLLASSSMVA